MPRSRRTEVTLEISARSARDRGHESRAYVLRDPASAQRPSATGARTYEEVTGIRRNRLRPLGSLED